MATIVSNRAISRPERRAVGLDLLLRLGGLALLLSALSAMFGGIWDIQWHVDVGPDTFLTAPHLFLYAGAAGAGLASLAVTLLSTWQVRQGVAPDPALVPLLRRTFWAPIGFIVAGIGSLLYLLFGLFDLWWHTVYGFDAVLDSPPHTGLGLSDVVTLAGGVMVFALLVTRERQEGKRGAWPVIGLAAMTAIFLINSASWQVGFVEPVVGAIDGQLLFVAALYPLALLMVASLARRAGVVALTALAFTLLAGGGWLLSAWATPVYAASLGLFPRDNALGFPIIVVVLPLLLLPVGIGIDLLLTLARRRQFPVRRGVMLAAGGGMALLVLLEGVAARGFFALPDTTALAATALAAAVVGAVSGWVGWQLGVVLRHLSGVSGEAVPQGAEGRPPVWRKVAFIPLLILGVAVASCALPMSATAHPGGPIVEVHQEAVDVGPYRVDVGFSDWPPRAERSLDIVFHLREGIAGKWGAVTLIAPSGAEETATLVRHPRQREDWGLDIIALPEEGTWTMRFAIDGPLGPGEGSMTLALGPRPGPPVIVGWLPALAIIGGIVTAVTVAWWRVRPGRLAETWAWT